MSYNVLVRVGCADWESMPVDSWRSIGKKKENAVSNVNGQTVEWSERASAKMLAPTSPPSQRSLSSMIDRLDTLEGDNREAFISLYTIRAPASAPPGLTFVLLGLNLWPLLLPDSVSDSWWSKYKRHTPPNVLGHFEPNGGCVCSIATLYQLLITQFQSISVNFMLSGFQVSTKPSSHGLGVSSNAV